MIYLLSTQISNTAMVINFEIKAYYQLTTVRLAYFNISNCTYIIIYLYYLKYNNDNIVIFFAKYNIVIYLCINSIDLGI